MIKTSIPKDLTNWQKKYGTGFVMYSIKTGRVIASADDYEKLIKKSEKKKVKRSEVSVIYLPDAKAVSIFPLSL